MIISNWKILFGLHDLYKNIPALWGLKTKTVVDISLCISVSLLLQICYGIVSKRPQYAGPMLTSHCVAVGLCGVQINLLSFPCFFIRISRSSYPVDQAKQQTQHNKADYQDDHDGHHSSSVCTVRTCGQERVSIVVKCDWLAFRVLHPN